MASTASSAPLAFTPSRADPMSAVVTGPPPGAPSAGCRPNITVGTRQGLIVCAASICAVTPPPTSLVATSEENVEQAMAHCFVFQLFMLFANKKRRLGGLCWR